MDYLGGLEFGTPRTRQIPGESIAFIKDDDVLATAWVTENDYDLRRYIFNGTSWQPQALPPSYNRSGSGLNDGWPTFDLVAHELYFEREGGGATEIARVRVDADGGIPSTFEVLTQLGMDVGDPDISRDGRRMYVSSRRRAGTDYDLYMFERCR